MQKRISGRALATYFHKYCTEIGEDGSAHFCNIVKGLFDIAMSSTVPAVTRVKAMDVILRYEVGLPIQRVDVTTKNRALALPPLHMTVTSSVAEAAVNSIINGQSESQ